MSMMIHIGFPMMNAATPRPFFHANGKNTDNKKSRNRLVDENVNKTLGILSKNGREH